MTLPPNLADALAQATGHVAAEAQPVGGGYINDAWRVELDDGRRAFVKTRRDAPAGEYATEAAGLRWLAEPRTLALPAVLGVHDPIDPKPSARLLVLEWVDVGQLDGAGEEELGRGLAQLHAAGAPAFGAPPPGAPAADGEVSPVRIGGVVLPNDPLPDWPGFYGEHRLRPLCRMALERGALPPGTERALQKVIDRLPDLTGPPEPPARLHGDLWSGNVLPGTDGHPRLIDPAAYGGHREIDLAMLRLFGGPGRRFFDAYHEAHPLADGHEERVALCQLLPLLVHAVLFGEPYGTDTARAARRYAG